MSDNILVITEQVNEEFRKPSFEGISEARCIADKNGGKVIVLIMGAGIEELTSIPSRYGADIVIQVDDDNVKTYQPDYYTAIVKNAVETYNINIILMPATDIGRDLAPRIAVQLEAGLAEDCLKIDVQGDKLVAERPMYAGKTIARVVVTSNIKVATLRPNVFAVLIPDDSRSAAVESLSIPDITPKTTVKEFKAAEGAHVDITEADIIVTGGRGMKTSENFKLLEDLTDSLGGVIGVTRAVVDNEWRPHSEQVGQTGKTVSPNLYMMFGASGSIQHWAGMSGAKCIVAVNKDPEAPIMAKADYSIVGDLFEIVPALTEEIRKIKG